MLDELAGYLDHPHSVLHSIEYLAMDATIVVSDFLYSISAFKSGVVKIQVCSDCLGGVKCLCVLCIDLCMYRHTTGYCVSMMYVCKGLCHTALFAKYILI